MRLPIRCFLAPAIILFATALAQAQTPKLVHSKNLSAAGENGNNFKINYGGSMGTGSLAGNLLTLRMTYPHGATLSSITDNKSSTYTLGATADSGSGGWVTVIYYVAGAAAGITQINANFSPSISDWHAALQEFSGVATSSPGDGTCSSSTTTPATVQCSSPIVTAARGDLVVATSMLVGGLGGNLCGNTSSSIMPGGSFALDDADPYCSDADEEFVQSAAGSVNPSFSIAGNSSAFNVVGMAFRPAAAGTNPTGMYILHQATVEINQGTSSQPNYFVSNGNLLVASVDDSNTNSGGNIVTIDSCSPANSWTKRSPNASAPQVFFIASPAVSTNLQCTVHSGQPGDTTLLAYYDVVGAAASPEDVDSGFVQSQGATISGPTLTPTTAPGIAFAVSNTGTGPTTGVSAGFIFDNTPYTGETDSGKLNNGDGWQHVFYNSTSPLAFTWTQANSSSWLNSIAIAFKAAPAGAKPAPPTNLGVTSIQ
jgi:hypothetical protein